MKKLDKDFFKKDSEIIAKELIGKVIKIGNKFGIIYETEAYKGLCDEASHAFPKKTPRNILMYDSYGKVYVYLIYGMHYCLNFTSDSDKPGAVLIRGIIDLDTGYKYDGPGKLTKFFGIDKSFNKEELSNSKKIEIFDKNIKVINIEKTRRIGIKRATDKLWRFVGNIIF